MLHGVRIGDPASTLNRSLMSRIDEDRVSLKDNNAISVSDGTVKMFVIFNHDLLHRMKLDKSGDVEFCLGKADRVSEIPGDSVLPPAREYTYLSRGLVIATEASSTGRVFRVEIR